jgi:protein SCO1
MVNADPEVRAGAAPAPAGKAGRYPGLEAAGAEIQRRAASLSNKPWFWVIWVVGVMAVMVIGAVRRVAPKPPELRLPLPAFELVNQRGEPFGSKDLRGRIWVADFVFTSCPTVCPKLTKRMGELQHRTRNLGDAFHLVTFTVDPENDTPERLAAYAKAYRASPRRWSFLTGSLASIEDTVVKGFKLAMGKEEMSPGSGLFSVFHGEKFVLVDREGMIRGYYDADDEGMNRLLRDVGVIVNIQ